MIQEQIERLFKFLKLKKSYERFYIHLIHVKDSRITFGPIPTGELILDMIDDYSRLPVLEKVHSKAVTTAIKKVEKVFAIFGTPDSVRFDNGPSFNSNEFKEFSKYSLINVSLRDMFRLEDWLESKLK